MHCIY